MGKKNYEGDLYVNGKRVLTEDDMPDTPVIPDIPENEGCQNNIVTLPEAIPETYAYDETITVENGKDVRLRNVGIAHFEIIDEDDENGYFKCNITFQTPNENLDIVIEPNNRAIRYYGLHCEDTIFTPQPKYHYRLNIFNDYGDLVCIVSGFPTESKYSDFISDIMININNLNSQIGDISTALDELHEYAQSLIAGGISE